MDVCIGSVVWVCWGSETWVCAGGVRSGCV